MTQSGPQTTQKCEKLRKNFSFRENFATNLLENEKNNINFDQILWELEWTRFRVHFCVWGQIDVNMLYVESPKPVIFGIQPGASKWTPNQSKI